LTHLSLTGVEAFYRKTEYTQFCRSPPKGSTISHFSIRILNANDSTLEFNENQRAVFCVFSGSGVKQLRHYLNQQKAVQRATREQNGNEVGEDMWDVDDGGINLPAGMEEDGSDDDLH